MIDSELLELAAKAAGINAQYSNNYGDFSIGEPYSRDEIRWNPLEDSGDALQLAVMLGFDVDVHRRTMKGEKPLVEVWGFASRRCLAVEQAEDNGESLQAATRRAIVLAAVEIEKAKL